MIRDKLGMAIIQAWRTNCRESISSLAAEQRRPVSTVFDRWKVLEEVAAKRFTTLLDTSLLAHPLRAWFAVAQKAREAPENKSVVQSLIATNLHVNNAYSTHRGFLVEFIARDLEQLHGFHSQLEEFGQVTRVCVLSQIIEEGVLVKEWDARKAS